ncbi:glycosyltransferase [Paraglaciecola sp. 25GB23A]|uniref:glycosyltransferase family 2 protein n=1 Tax=Paraglaciecola sp. 25GB23A TaxID=3156068 RepID=UPI0032AFD89F
MNINSAPMVSVVVPMYNVEKYIEQCIESVLAQHFQNFELILVDDGCSDKTLQLVSQFSDSRIRLIRQQNRGLSGARNTGIDAARGLYIALLDADDYWKAEKLSAHIAHLNRNPKVGVSYCPSLFVDDNGQLLGIGQYPKLRAITAQHVFCRNPVGNGSAAVIRRSVLADIATYGKGSDRQRRMYFNETLKQSEDIELWTRIALNTQWQFEGIAAALTYYRVNDGGLSANLTRQFSSWQQAVSLNQANAPQFFKEYYNLAKAYQLRYLARRAIQTNNALQGLSLVHKALLCDYRILLQEPMRTLITLCSAWLKLLPNGLYKRIEHIAMSRLGRRMIS